MLFAAAVLISCAVSGPADPVAPAATREYHVRALDPRVREWIKLGAAHSRTLDDLLSRLTKSDLIVYVEMVDRIRERRRRTDLLRHDHRDRALPPGRAR